MEHYRRSLSGFSWAEKRQAGQAFSTAASGQRENSRRLISLFSNSPCTCGAGLDTRIASPPRVAKANRITRDRRNKVTHSRVEWPGSASRSTVLPGRYWRTSTHFPRSACRTVLRRSSQRPVVHRRGQRRHHRDAAGAVGMGQEVPRVRQGDRPSDLGKPSCRPARSVRR